MSEISRVGSNQKIKDAIQKIALHTLVNAEGAVNGTERVAGFVAKIHKSGDLAGTIDVQEFSSVEWGDPDTKTGYHEGVYLSAMQNTMDTMVIIPKLYSEVVIVKDPVTKNEYVSMFSHVDIIQMDSYDTVSIGVTEREEYQEDENSPDIGELELTGSATKTEYKKDSITTTVTIEDEEYNRVTLDEKGITAVHKDATVSLGDDNISAAFGGSSVVVKDDTVYLGSESGTDDAVLGVELANILADIVDYISQIKTSTMIGPQPPLNMAQFIALKAKINSFKSSHSGFLTKTVQIRK